MFLLHDLSEVSQHVCCFAQTLQRVIKDGFKQAGSINKVLSKVSVIVSHVRKSIGVQEKCLKAATVTKWNSQLTMIQSILRISEEKLNSLGTHELTT